jgi:hypothetical protein
MENPSNLDPATVVSMLRALADCIERGLVTPLGVKSIGSDIDPNASVLLVTLYGIGGVE